MARFYNQRRSKSQSAGAARSGTHEVFAGGGRMSLELWQILGNQAFDDAFYADMLFRSHADTATDVLMTQDTGSAQNNLTMP